MPESTPPKLPMADDKFSSSRLRASKNLIGRLWLCLDEQTIAAYVDHTLGQCRKKRVEAHLAECERCRYTVAEIVKLQRAVDLASPPIEVAPAPLRTAPVGYALSRWFWVPAGAIAVLGLIAISIGVLRPTRDLLILPPPTPPARMVAKVEPANPPITPVPEIVREPQVRETQPVVVSPLEGRTVAREYLAFNWKPVAHTRYYEVRVVTSDGDLRWHGRTTESALRLPSNVALSSGSYFVWITAYRTDGTVSKSPPVRFLVKR